MLLTELDGLLTGVVVSPELIMPGEWPPLIWEGSDGGAPFDEPADVQTFLDMLMARYNKIIRDLGRGKLQPIFDVDERNGEIFWEFWLDGFDRATRMRAGGWAAITLGGNSAAADAVAGLTLLLEVARDGTDLMSEEINELGDAAPELIRQHVAQLHGWRVADQHTAPEAGRPVAGVRTGRNEACPCGSGKKYERCCGST